MQDTLIKLILMLAVLCIIAIAVLAYVKTADVIPGFMEEEEASLNSGESSRGKLIKSILSEIEREDFNTPLVKLSIWEADLRDNYDFRFNREMIRSIGAYRRMVLAIYYTNASLNEAQNKAMFIEHMTTIQTYLKCKYSAQYTTEQVLFLKIWIAQKLEESKRSFGAIEIEKCN